MPAVLLLACAGTEAGGRWVVDDDGWCGFHEHAGGCRC